MGYTGSATRFGNLLCKECPPGRYVHPDKAPGKAITECTSCPQGKKNRVLTAAPVVSNVTFQQKAFKKWKGANRLVQGTSGCLFLIVPFWYTWAAYQARLLEPWCVFWRDAVEPKHPWRDQTSLICRRSVLKRYN